MEKKRILKTVAEGILLVGWGWIMWMAFIHSVLFLGAQ